MISFPRYIFRHVVLLCLLFFFPFCSLFAQDDVLYVMNVELSDGGLLTYNLSEKPKVTFGKDSISIQSSTYEYIGYSKINRITFGTQGVNAIASQPQYQVTVTPASGEIIFSNVDPASRVEAYSVDGRKLNVDSYTIDGRIIVRLASYPKGIIIFRVNNHSFKISKK